MKTRLPLDRPAVYPCLKSAERHDADVTSASALYPVHRATPLSSPMPSPSAATPARTVMVAGPEARPHVLVPIGEGYALLGARVRKWPVTSSQSTPISAADWRVFASSLSHSVA